jgi:D-3-phosphoglycerate dehydrogenase
MALLLALVRKIAFADAQVQAGQWRMSAVTPIHRLRRGVLGLVGFGKIPKLVAPKAQLFGLRVVAYDQYVSKEVMSAARVEGIGVSELLRISACISIHTPLVPETRGEALCLGGVWSVSVAYGLRVAHNRDAVNWGRRAFIRPIVIAVC